MKKIQINNVCMIIKIIFSISMVLLPILIIGNILFVEIIPIKSENINLFYNKNRLILNSNKINNQLTIRIRKDIYDEILDKQVVNLIITKTDRIPIGLIINEKKYYTSIFKQYDISYLFGAVFFILLLFYGDGEKRYKLMQSIYNNKELEHEKVLFVFNKILFYTMGLISIILNIAFIHYDYLKILKE